MDNTIGSDIDSTNGSIFFSFINVCSIPNILSIEPAHSLVQQKNRDPSQQCHLDKMANQDLSIRYNTGVFLFVTFNNKCLTLKRKCAAAFAIE